MTVSVHRLEGRTPVVCARSRRRWAPRTHHPGRRGAHPRCVVLIEGSEESGSPDLLAYVEALADVIGTPQLIVCLDSGAADYEHLWLTTSLRGMAAGNLTVCVVEEGLHSGGCGGFVLDGFRILRSLLDRIEDSEDERVLLPEAWVEVPQETKEALARAAKRVGAGRVGEAPLAPGADALITQIGPCMRTGHGACCLEYQQPLAWPRCRSPRLADEPAQ